MARAPARKQRQGWRVSARQEPATPGRHSASEASRRPLTELGSYRLHHPIPGARKESCSSTARRQPASAFSAILAIPANDPDCKPRTAFQDTMNTVRDTLVPPPPGIQTCYLHHPALTHLPLLRSSLSGEPPRWQCAKPASQPTSQNANLTGSCLSGSAGARSASVGYHHPPPLPHVPPTNRAIFPPTQPAARPTTSPSRASTQTA